MAAWWPRTAGSIGVMLFGIGGAIGCSAYTTLKDVSVDCTVEDDYVFLMVNDFEIVGESAWWTAPDPTVGATMTADVEAIEDGARCGGEAATVIRSSHNNDWGSLAGYNNFGPRDGAEYEGVAFWMRAVGNTTKGLTLLLGDPNSADLAGAYCKVYESEAGSAQSTGTTIDPNTGVATSSSSTSRQAYPDECGNLYSTTMLATSEWGFYTVPFERFHQDALPNRVPNRLLTETGPVPGTGLLTDQLFTLTLRMQKEAQAEFWVDDLKLYRTKAGAGLNSTER